MFFFVATSKNEADFAGQNYLINRNNRVVAVINGEEVEKQVLQGMVGVTAANIGDYLK